MKYSFALLFVALLPRIALADTCIVIDEVRDTLTAEERKAVLTLAEQEFIKLGKKVNTTDCTETYTLIHGRLGQSVTVILSGPTGSQKMTAASIEEVPDVYSRLIPAVVKGTTVEATVSRDNVTADESEPKRIEADSLFALTVGDGMFSGGYTLLNLGASYRWELDNLAISAGGDIMVDISGEGRVFGYGGIGIYYIPGEEKDASAYFGGGLGFGAGGAPFGAGAGFTPRLSAGYMALRSTSIRVFGQLDVSLPTWMLQSFRNDNTAWSPAIGINLGIAFKPPERRGISIF